MTLRQAQLSTTQALSALYEQREAANICDWVMEHLTGKRKIDRLLDADLALTTSQQIQLEEYTRELLAHRPVQYVLGEAWFAGMRFGVNESVLIPRPETEELVDWIVTEMQNTACKTQNLLDIGTGSGCIPVSIKKKFPSCIVTAIDSSEAALKTAAQNAAALDTAIHFQRIDFLNKAARNQLPVFDIITSNPPYIKQSESLAMRRNVLDFEPSLALFVPDEDALLFYRHIALFGQTHLSKNGSVFLEINESLGREVVQLFTEQGFDCEARKDLQGKDRMVKAVKKS